MTCSNTIFLFKKRWKNTMKSLVLIFISLPHVLIMVMITNIYTVYQNYQRNFKFRWLQQMMYTIIIHPVGNCRISLHAFGKNVQSIMLAIVCTKMLKDILNQ